MKCLATWAGRRFSSRTLLIPCMVSTPSSSPFSRSRQSHSVLERRSWCLATRNTNTELATRLTSVERQSSPGRLVVRMTVKMTNMMSLTRWWTVWNWVREKMRSRLTLNWT